MSENFRGVTFAEQDVTPADDAIVRRAIMPDGILTGCEISYSGSTLTMAAGYIIACGRTFQHIAAQNWAVVDATSGFARLVLTIDLTKTATEATFNQIESSIEYAAAEDGFVDLEQSDINLSGTRYQIAAAVVSLGTGGITGIVSQLALSRVEGGGGLNFSVVDGLTQPGDPKENMIWVYTEGMTGWYMQPTQPEGMLPGEVWFSTGKDSTVAFDALKKNTVMVYPLSAKQMGQDGVLVDVTAKSWQDGEWVEWVTEIVLYANGILNTTYTNTGNVTDKGTYLVFNTVESLNTSGKNVIFAEKFNPTAYSKVSIDYELVGGHKVSGTKYLSHELVLFDDSGNAITSVPLSDSGHTEIDTSTATGVTSCRTGLRSYIAKQWVKGDANITTNIYELVVVV